MKGTVEVMLMHDDMKDYLTGLHTRQGMYLEWKENLSGYDAVQVLFVDLDNFKTVNDLYGHKAGDCTLTRMGELLLGYPKMALRSGSAAMNSSS